MPRTPAVFPAKTKWPPKEQLESGGTSEEARRSKGVFRQSYTSALGFANEAEGVLDKQALAGQVLALPEEEAKILYGDRLTMAFLSALEKGVGEDGVVEVRVLPDGTNGVQVNKFIRALEGGISPTAQGVKTCLRIQAARGVPHCSLTAGVEDAHRVVFVRPE